MNGNVEKAAIPGESRIECLGGNHSRAAMTSLFRIGLWSPFVFVTIYNDLTDDECLKIGFEHNEIAKLVNNMSFLDIVRVVKKYKDEDVNNLRKNLKAIFNKR